MTLCPFGLVMHDIKFIRDNPVQFDEGLAHRGLPAMSADIVARDRKRRSEIAAAEAYKRDSNTLSKQAGIAKTKRNAEEFESLRRQVTQRKELASNHAKRARELESELKALLLTLPNLPYADVPVGEDETANVEIRRWGSPRHFHFAPREHFEIPSVQHGMDFATAANVSGSRFVLLSGSIARLHRALAQFMIDLHVADHGLIEVWTPVLVNSDAMQGTGQLPKFAEDSYCTENGKWLIPTAEVTLTNIVRERLVSEDYLPRRYCAHTQCFRSEAGSAGKDTAGMLRQHQFEKVEMVSITKPETSDEEQQRMLRCAETVLEKLELPYRTVILCTGDMGFGARRTFDIEVWLPGQDNYREISSISTCGDFQARRMNARYRPRDRKGTEFVHTLNGSGLAVGRTLIAVLENGQQDDGSIRLPGVLARYLDGHTTIRPDGQLD